MSTPLILSHSDSSMHRTGSRLPTVEQSTSSVVLSHTLREEMEPRNTWGGGGRCRSPLVSCGPYIGSNFPAYPSSEQRVTQPARVAFAMPQSTMLFSQKNSDKNNHNNNQQEQGIDNETTATMTTTAANLSMYAMLPPVLTKPMQDADDSEVQLVTPDRLQTQQTST